MRFKKMMHNERIFIIFENVKVLITTNKLVGKRLDHFFKYESLLLYKLVCNNHVLSAILNKRTANNFFLLIGLIVWREGEKESATFSATYYNSPQENQF